MFDNMLVSKREGSPTTSVYQKVIFEECTVEYSVYFNDKTGDVDSYMDVYSLPNGHFLCGLVSAQSKWRELQLEVV